MFMQGGCQTQLQRPMGHSVAVGGMCMGEKDNQDLEDVTWMDASQVIGVPAQREAEWQLELDLVMEFT